MRQQSLSGDCTEPLCTADAPVDVCTGSIVVPILLAGPPICTATADQGSPLCLQEGQLTVDVLCLEGYHGLGQANADRTGTV